VGRLRQFGQGRVPQIHQQVERPLLVLGGPVPEGVHDSLEAEHLGKEPRQQGAPEGAVRTPLPREVVDVRPEVDVPARKGTNFRLFSFLISERKSKI
jgi:hypothetical protein